jgi:hypothetical protein
MDESISRGVMTSKRQPTTYNAREKEHSVSQVTSRKNNVNHNIWAVTLDSYLISMNVLLMDKVEIFQ